MTIDIQQAVRAFRDEYDRAPDGAARAPGRVNLIGEHTDYNEGYVLPIAIERETVAVWAHRDDGLIRLRSRQADARAEVNLQQHALIKPGAPAWANYPKGVARKLYDAEVPLAGADVLFDSDVPIGGGLSSSASLEVATACALLEAADRRQAVTGMDLAVLCQQAEHEFAGTPCGIMDQSIAILGQADHALLLDCFDGSTRQVPFDNPDVVLLVADTQVQHELSDGGYAARRQQCHNAAEQIGVRSLRHATLAAVESAELDGRLGKPERRRARHVVSEIARTLQAVDALEARDYQGVGKLMYASHASLRDDYEVSCAELDHLVDVASGLSGVYGARMTGGGFGGCAIALVAADRAEQIVESLAHAFEEKFARRCPVFATRAADGAGPAAV